MKKYRIVFVALLFAGVFLLGSCYAKKKGIVPCPHGFNDVQTEMNNEIPTEPV